MLVFIMHSRKKFRSVVPDTPVPKNSDRAKELSKGLRFHIRRVHRGGLHAYQIEYFIYKVKIIYLFESLRFYS